MKAPDIKTTLPGPKAKAIIERDHQYTAPAYGRVYPLVVEQGRGMVIEDVDGNLCLDFMAGIAVCSTGHTESTWKTVGTSWRMAAIRSNPMPVSMFLAGRSPTT